MARPQFSIIISMLNERDRIGPCLEQVRKSCPDCEFIVVDGGSQDGSREIARQKGARVIDAEKGRGIQFNAGARLASAPYLFFLHADTRVSPDAFRQIRACFEGPRGQTYQIGTFRMAFDEPRWILRLYSFFTRFDTIWTSFGDQGIFVRKAFFEAIGGFPEWPLFEDVRLLQKARKRTKVRSLPGPVTTSARRFMKRGIIRQQLFNAYLIARYLMGAQPKELYEKYYQ
jgi:rSAM/selenodomain-associated transferase 2